VANALRRRARQQGRPAVVAAGELEINLLERRVRFAGAEVRLHRKQFEVLKILAEKADQVIASQTILRAVWGRQSTDRVVYLRLVIRDLRCKLEADPAHPGHILTERGLGYRLVREPPGDTSHGRASAV
jgi:two-component system, OmpR family, KDP operon response regulator KdpE